MEIPHNPGVILVPSAQMLNAVSYACRAIWFVWVRSTLPVCPVRCAWGLNNRCYFKRSFLRYTLPRQQCRLISDSSDFGCYIHSLFSQLVTFLFGIALSPNAHDFIRYPPSYMSFAQKADHLFYAANTHNRLWDALL